MLTQLTWTLRQDQRIRAGGWQQGFSTISMQLARNVFPERISREKTLVRKLKEAKVARAIEARYTKDKILELYLNQIYLGNGAYGIETAAQRYFGKSARDLSVAEAVPRTGVIADLQLGIDLPRVGRVAGVGQGQRALRAERADRRCAGRLFRVGDGRRRVVVRDGGTRRRTVVGDPAVWRVRAGDRGGAAVR